MNSDYPDNTEEALDALLNELGFEPASAMSVSHQAPAGLRQRILAAQHAESPKPSAANSGYAHWLLSPWRAVVASMATLLLGVLLGTSTPAAELYSGALNSTSYPDNDQLLVIASLDDDFTASLGQELFQDWEAMEAGGGLEPSASTGRPTGDVPQ